MMLKRKMAASVLLACFAAGYAGGVPAECERLEQRVDSVLRLMTLSEKVGQMNQLSNKEVLTGQLIETSDLAVMIRSGKTGSLLNEVGVEPTRRLQEMAVNETRLGIPLIFALDVIHGFRTISPIPLAESCSWDLEAIE